MKSLFLSTYNLTIDKDHHFTRDVLDSLYLRFHNMGNELAVASILFEVGLEESFVTEEQYKGMPYYKLHTSSLLKEKLIVDVCKLYEYVAPSIIHSNMMELIDVEAAKLCNIPIVSTIHVGGFLCPRGSASGFLKYDDNICDTKIGHKCFRCCAKDFPLPPLARFLYWSIPTRFREWAYNKFKGKQVFYLTQFLERSHDIIEREKAIETYKHATIIAANYRLKEILALNGLTENVVVLPHGVKARKNLPISKLDNVIRLCFFGRIAHIKGLHLLFKALQGIDKSLFELHVIGDAAPNVQSQLYKRKIVKMSKGMNVFWYSWLPNSEIESVIKDMHVMIHPTICLEVYGLTIAESLSIGRPVLASRCGGAEMQIQNGVNGWLVEPNSVTALRDKILYIIQHKEEIISMSNNCRLPHPLSEYTEGLLTLYNKLLS